jgi:hypothetical protein
MKCLNGRMRRRNVRNIETPFQMIERVKAEMRQKITEEDYEAATSLERIMWRDVLTFISMNAVEEPNRLAKAALETVQWTFRRW